MAVQTLNSQRKFLAGTSNATLHRRAGGVIELHPDNLIPNSSLTDLDATGEPTHFDLSWGIPKIVSWLVNVSRPGTAAHPPRLRQAVRQTVSGVPPEEGSWTMEEPWVAGMKIAPTSDVVPPYPTLEAVPSGNRGFQGGTHGWAWGLSGRFGPTTTTAVRYFALANGEVPRFPVPDAVRAPGVKTWDIYMVRVNRGASTLSLQRRIPVGQLREEDYKVNGPWRKRGKPPASNRSGVGNLAAPRDRDSRLVDSGFDMPVGRWQAAVQVEVAGGTSLLGRWGKADRVEPSRVRVKVAGPGPKDEDPPGGHGNELRKPDEKTETAQPEFHYEWRVLPHKKNTSLKLRKPRFVRGRRGRGMRYTYWLRHTSPQGVVKTYRVLRPGGRGGAVSYFDVPSLVVACEVSDSEAVEESPRKRKTPEFTIVEEELPAEDTTVIEAPDPSEIPDEPIRSGQQVPDAGRYLATVTGVLEDGGYTRPSAAGINSAGLPHQDIAAGEMLKVNLPATLNLLRNAEFARRDAVGQPEDWAGSGMSGNNSFSAEEGVLTVRATTSTSTVPLQTSRRVPFDPANTPTITVAGTIGANSVTAGSVRVRLRQFDESGAQLGSDLIVADIASAVEVPFSARYGDGGTALDPNTASMRLVVGLAGSTVNAEGYFKNLRVLGLPTDVRYVEYGEDGPTFDAAPDIPVPGQSFIAAATAPEAEQPVPAEQAPPLSLLTFEDNAHAGWTAVGNAPNRGVQAGAAIHGSLGYRVQDSSTGNSHTGYLERTEPALALPDTPSAFRALYVFDQLPTSPYSPYLEFHETRSTRGEARVAYLRVGQAGGLRLYVYAGGWKAFSLGVSLSAGDVLDLETIVTPGRDGRVDVGIGINGQRRIVFSRAFDLRGRSPNLFRAGVVRVSGSAMRYNARFDQVVVTETGDVLDREKPRRPVDYVAPPLDRPLKPAVPAWSPKTVRAVGQQIVPTVSNAHRYVALNAGTSGPNEPTFPLTGTVRDNAGLVAVARSTAYALGASVLKPSGTGEDAEWYEVTTAGTTGATAPAYPTTDGVTVTDGTAVLTTRKTVQWQEAGGLHRTFDWAEEKIGQIYALLAPGAAPPGDPAIVPLLDDPIPVRPGQPYTVATFMRSVPFDETSPGIRAWLEAEDGSAEPYVAASIPMRAGGWHAGGEVDDFAVVNVPEGYDLLRLEWVLHDGVHILQEPLVSLGNLTAFADRDARRRGGRAASGAGSWTFDLKPEGYDLGIQPGVFVSEFGVKETPALPDADAEPVGTLTAAFFTSDDKARWLAYDSVNTQPMRFLRMDLAFVGDGFSGPEAATLYARTWSPVGVLLREDGTHFPGVAWIGMLTTSPYPEVDIRRVGGRLALVPTGDPIERVEDQEVHVGVTTEEARREIQYLSSIGPLRAEVPHLGGTVAGQSVLLTFDGYLELTPDKVPSRIDPAIGRVLYASGTLNDAEVLEAAPLQEPMRVIDFSAAKLVLT